MNKSRIDSYLDGKKEEMIAVLKELVSIPSYKQTAEADMPFGRNPAKVLACALSHAERFGLNTRNLDNYIGWADMGSGDPGLGILVHLDVVGEGSGWNYPPYEGVIEDGRMYARGTADNKGPAVAALFALNAVNALGIPLKRSVRLIFGCDEESGGADIKYYRKYEKMPPEVFSPDGEYPLVNIEKGGLNASFSAQWPDESGLSPRISSVKGGYCSNVVPSDAEAVVEGMEKQMILGFAEEAEVRTGAAFAVAGENGAVRITVKGKSAHAAAPEKGINAVTALIDMLVSMPFGESLGFNALKAIAGMVPHGEYDGASAGIACSDKVSGALTLAFTLFEYNGKGLKGRFDIRAAVCATKQGVLDKLAESLEVAGIDMERSGWYEPHVIKEETALVKTLLKVYSEQTGLRPYCIAIGGGTYVHNIEGGVTFGCRFPGAEDRMHGPDEYIELNELLLNARIFAHAIVALCGR